MKILVTGGTGFTGSRVVRDLHAAGHRVRCLVRPGTATRLPRGVPATVCEGDLADEPRLADALGGCDALVNVASIGFGHAPGVVRAAERAGVGRAVFFSTTAIFTRLPAPSREVRTRAEEAIRRSALAFTILRPTMIYGAPGDRNVERLLSYLARYRIVPLVGAGDRLIQPVLVDDLARAVTAVLAHDAAEGRAYQLAGRDPLTFRQFVTAAARAMGVKALVVPVPPPLVLGAAGLWESLSRRPRIRREQVLRLMEDKDFDWSPAGRDFGYSPATVEEGLRRAVEHRRREEET